MTRRPNAYGASIMGFTSSGDAIIHFPSDNRPVLPEGAELLDFDPASGAAIIRYPPPQQVLVPSEGVPRVITFENQVQKPEAAVQEEPSPSSSSTIAARSRSS